MKKIPKEENKKILLQEKSSHNVIDDVILRNY